MEIICAVQSDLNGEDGTFAEDDGGALTPVPCNGRDINATQWKCDYCRSVYTY